MKAAYFDGDNGERVREEAIPAELEAAVGPRTQLILLNTPHNPTGTMWSADDMRELASIVDGTDILLIGDEVYEHIVFDGRRHESLLRYPELRLLDRYDVVVPALLAALLRDQRLPEASLRKELELGLALRGLLLRENRVEVGLGDVPVLEAVPGHAGHEQVPGAAVPLLARKLREQREDLRGLLVLLPSKLREPEGLQLLGKQMRRRTVSQRSGCPADAAS